MEKDWIKTLIFLGVANGIATYLLGALLFYSCLTSKALSDVFLYLSAASFTAGTMLFLLCGIFVCLLEMLKPK